MSILDPQADDLDLDRVHRGQMRIALRLASRCQDRLLHVHGLGWHWWDGQRWTFDDGAHAERELHHVLRVAWIEARHDADLAVDVRRCESSAGIDGALRIAATLAEFATTVRDLDADPWLLNCANGVVDLRTGELSDHNPADRITKLTTAAYDPDAAGPTWGTFLDRVLPDVEVRGFLQRVIGLSLLGKVLEHRLPILSGTGRNGKGVFYGAVCTALGDYAATADPELFMHRDGAVHPTGQMDLLGRRLVVVSESDQSRRLAEATVKRLTGGDKLKARKMRQDFVEFDPSHLAILITNHLPRVSGDDPALWARLRVVPFTVTIPETEQDPHLGDKLRLEADAVLAWSMAGWIDYQRRGLAEPDAVTAATGVYQRDSDDIGTFLAEECLTGPHLRVTFADLWERWCQWSSESGAAETPKRAFGRELGRRGFAQYKSTGGVRGWLGVNLQGR